MTENYLDRVNRLSRQLALDLRNEGYDFHSDLDDPPEDDDQAVDAILRKVGALPENDPTRRQFLQELQRRGADLDRARRELLQQQELERRGQRIAATARATGIDPLSDPEIAEAVTREDADTAEIALQCRAIEQATPEQAAELVDTFTNINRQTARQAAAQRSEEGQWSDDWQAGNEPSQPMLTKNKSLDEMTPEELQAEIDAREERHGF